MTDQIPAQYLVVLAGATAIYGSLSVMLIHVLRRLFPIEGNGARILTGAVSACFGILAAVQIGITTIPDLPPEQRILGVLGLVGATWWTSQEIYRRLRGDLWGTRSVPSP